ncbi:uncharacterized protein MONBRDRAFT_10466 [Monosiga brevicollis MX1]|uniref:Cytochrome P450 n=1 Tax=Monosiga brevicollis TaxID=81824 RepID=A9V6A1_MONBE|nr:uncharacterized protein MONBRDRAFT_10466 [Monosiga brevicollis MX1]EDQ86955.1 predicted protein [Monosiga brevicollis MX1]|eukprot:XP_001748194.1 hypothetical protein [Monosiga brevicollis MX1]
MWLFITVVLAFVGLAVWLRERARMRFPGGSRDILLHMTGWLQGLRTEVIQGDVARAHHVLVSKGSDKGRVIEENMMLPVWTDGCSIESCNGRVWRTVRHSYDHFVRQLPPIEDLETYCLQHTPSITADAGVLDSPGIARTVLAAFGQHLFADACTPQHLDVIEACSWDIRAHVAMRTNGHDDLKRACNRTIINLLEQSAFESPPDLPGWQHPLAFSAVMQPFFISPSVNFVDIVIALDNLCDLRAKSVHWRKQGYGRAKMDIVAHLVESIRIRHPFPMLERLHGDTQYFIALDSFFAPGHPQAAFNPTQWHAEGMYQDPLHSLIFGAGPRKCPGRTIAWASLPALLYRWLELEAAGHLTWRPADRHRFSGRDLDNAPTPMAESLHAAGRIVSCLANLAFETRRPEYTDAPPATPLATLRSRRPNE